MRRLISLTILLLLSMTMFVRAQTYDSLWKKAQSENGKDLPKTAISTISAIEGKAAKERNYGQLLKARFVMMQLRNNISTDSIEVDIVRLMQTADSEKNPALASLYHIGVAQFLSQYGDDDIDNPRDKAREHMLASLVDMEALGKAKARDFIPAIELAEKKHDMSRIFDGDLLNVIVRSVLSDNLLDKNDMDTIYDRVISYYEARGNRSAAAMFALDAAIEESDRLDDDEEDDDISPFTSLLQKYDDTEAAVFIYEMICTYTSQEDTVMKYSAEAMARFPDSPQLAVIKDARNKVLQPEAHLHYSHETMIPGISYDFTIEVENVSDFKIQICRTDLSRAEYMIKSDKGEDAVKKINRQNWPVVFERDVKVETPSYHTSEFVIPYTPSAPGVYLLRFFVNGKEECVEALYASGISLVVQQIHDKAQRITAVESRSGAPLQGATIHYLTHSYATQDSVKVGSDGSITLPHKDYRLQERLIWATTNTDMASSPIYIYNGYSGYDREEKADTSVYLFSDRSLYRPGQQLQFAGVLYQKKGNETHVLPHHKIVVRLTNNQGNELSQCDVETDDLGNISGSFTIPESVLTGNLTLTTDYGSHSVRVEYYKRPTFEVEFAKVDTAYRLGDKVCVKGLAKTLTGRPLTDARVNYVVKFYRSNLGWWYHRSRTSEAIAGESTTDASGNFSILIPLEIYDKDKFDGRESDYAFYNYVVTADVVGPNLETHTADTRLRVSRRSRFIHTKVAGVLLTTATNKAEVQLVNSSETPISEQGRFSIERNGDVVLQGSFTTNNEFTLPSLSKLPSGSYDLIAAIGEGTADALVDTKRIVLFSPTDKTPPTEEPMFVYADESSSHTYFGTSLSGVTIFYDIIGARHTYTSKRIAMSYEVQKFDLSYRPEYGDGAVAVFAFVKDGILYRHEQRIVRPKPDKRLILSWETFRDNLTPGATEEWRLRITYPDGKPAPAALMATLYDASLDLIYSGHYDYELHFYRDIPSAGTRINATDDGDIYANLTPDIYVRPVSRSFDTFDALHHRDFPFYGYGYARYGLHVLNELAVTSAAPLTAVKRIYKGGDEMEDEMEDAIGAAPIVAGMSADEQQEHKASVRTAFAETAMFAPCLRTDGKGRISLVFTLPQSLTKWQFRGFAHTADMHYVNAEATATATKSLMVEPNIPRFLRSGDSTRVAATIRNVSKNKESGIVRFEVFDPSDGQTLTSHSADFAVEPDASQTLSFTYTPDASHSLVAIRIVAEGQNASDGEQHYLPILSDRIMLTSSLPLLMKAKGSHVFDIDSLLNAQPASEDNKSLCVELTNSPAWYAAMALPAMADANAEDAYSLASSYYAYSLATHIAQQNPQLISAFTEWSKKSSDSTEWWNSLARNPELKQLVLAETPWISAANRENERFSRLVDFFTPANATERSALALQRLTNLQLSSGAWPWYKGMHESRHTTAYNAVMLARLSTLITLDEEAKHSLDKAMAYLDEANIKRVAEIREWESKYKSIITLSEWQLQYLYAVAITKRSMPPATKSAVDFLLARLEGELAYDLSMYGKASSAVILAHFGKADKARLALRSLMEYTVYRPDMGRYFDTERALRGYSSYGIPTQVAAIEAMQLLRQSPDTIDDLHLWLLQSKRTQAWGNPRSTADAIHALISSPSGVVSFKPSEHPLYFTLTHGGEITATNARSEVFDADRLGYSFSSYTSDTPPVSSDHITIHKSSEGVSWGAVYGTYTLPAGDVVSEAKGLSLQRKIEVGVGGERHDYTIGEVIPAGARVYVTYLIDADRDYDFVSVRAPHAACLEPLDALSGYNGYAYRSIGDAATTYYFDHIHKGKTRLSDTFVVTREGTFQMGAAIVSCVYSPEFTGRTSGTSINVQIDK